MTPQEAIEKKARELETYYCTTYEPCDLAEMFKGMALFALSLEGWVSVKERLPEDYERVLFWNDSEAIPFGICEIGYFVPSQSEIPSHITHWRTLPSPPTKDETK